MKIRCKTYNILEELYSVQIKTVGDNVHKNYEDIKIVKKLLLIRKEVVTPSLSGLNTAAHILRTLTLLLLRLHVWGILR